MENNTNNNAQNSATTQPEGNGAPGGERTFTQEEVNRIVSERLARERAKTEPTEEEKRLADLKARESKITCNEYLAATGYSKEVSAGMLEMFDTSDAEKFKKNVEKLIKTFPAIIEPISNPTAPTDTTPVGNDILAGIFRPKI